MRFRLILVTLCLVMSPAIAMAQGCDGLGNCYVRQGATGTGDGSSWTNACPDLVTSGGNSRCNMNSMLRGATYWVAAGSYASVTGLSLFTSDSGTTPITLSAVTTSNHGPATDWSSTYVGQAQFGAASTNIPCGINTDYWVIDGQYGSGPNAAAYGFRCAWSSSNALNLADMRLGYGGNPVGNITVRYMAVVGSNGNGGTECEDGIQAVHAVPGASYLFEHNLITQANTWFNVTGAQNVTIQYNYGNQVYYWGGCHGDGINFANGANNLVIRYNVWQDAAATSVYAQPCGTCSPSSNVYIYGDQILWTSAGGVSGDAILWSSPGTGVTGDFYFVNNTIDNFSSSHYGGTSWTIPENSGGTTWGNVHIQNNLITNSVAVTAGVCPGTCTSFTWANQAYYNTGNSGDPDPNKQVLTSNPFVNEPALNLQLVSDTGAGSALTNSGINTFTLDPRGVVRGVNGVWDRGAYQYTGATTATKPNPPTNLATTGVS